MRQSHSERHPPLGPVTTEALARLSYLLERPFGCGVVVGPARSGKSALLRVLTEACLRSGARTAVVDGQGMDSRSLMWELAAQWRIAPTLDGSSRLLAQQVRDYLHGATRAGQRLAILVDHADRLDDSGVLALARILCEFEQDCGLTVVWAGDMPLRGDAVDHLLPFTELRIECPALSRNDTAQFAKQVWKHSAGDPLSDVMADEIAELSHSDLRRAERLSRLAQLASLADGSSLTSDTLSAVSAELA
jgi:type II secretory pathway predicted ATPase ExeA